MTAPTSGFSMPSSPIPSVNFPTTDPNEHLRRIEQNTAGLLAWMKILVVLVLVLTLVNVAFLA